MLSREKETLYRAELIMERARSLTEEINETASYSPVVTVDRRLLTELILLAEWNAETVINNANDA